MFPFRKKEFFTEAQKEELVQAVRDAERLTSGEIRLYVESKCRFVDPLHRAIEVFHALKMDQTPHRNAVLLYLAMKDRQFAIYGDRGIHQKVEGDYWKRAVRLLSRNFKEGKMIEGLKEGILEIGHSLQHHFPHEQNGTNELPDDLVFGR